MKKYRFFYHYFKQKKRMSIHFRGACTVVDNVVCKVPCETKWNKTQPNLVMRGYASAVSIEDGIATIS
jgi:hypothetical protein